MEANTPPVCTEERILEKIEITNYNSPLLKRQSLGTDDDEQNSTINSTIHGFNCSNITVIETKDVSDSSKLNIRLGDEGKHNTTHDGSDSGVETLEPPIVIMRARSISSCCEGDGGTPALSCDSSVISCCSNYEDAYEVLARRNSVLLEDLRGGEGGSESSSVSGSCDGRSKRSTTSTKKRVNLTEPIKQERTNQSTLNASVRNQTRSKTPVRSYSVQERSKSKERTTKPPITPKPTKLQTSTPRPRLNIERPSSGSEKSNSGSSIEVRNDRKDRESLRRDVNQRIPTNTRSKTPVRTPTDDGRWPSNTKSASKNLKNNSSIQTTKNTEIKSSRLSTLELKSSTFDKYATLPRRRKEKSTENIPSREPSENRAANLRKQLMMSNRDSLIGSTPVPLGRTLPPYPRKKAQSKTKIYHEAISQTVVTGSDIESALKGEGVNVHQPGDVEKLDKEIQVDRRHEKLDQLEAQIKALQEKNNKLNADLKEQKDKNATLEQSLAVEKVEKQALKEELESQVQRIQTMLGNVEGTNEQLESGKDSFMMLESRFQKAGQVILKQENEISELYSACRQLQKDLEKSITAQRTLYQQQQDLEKESIELQEFMSAEKSTLAETLHEAEAKIKTYQKSIIDSEEQIMQLNNECRILSRVNEQRRQENLSLQARMGAVESHTRDLLLQQGAAVSGASLALSAFTSRIDVLTEQLVASYAISDKDLEDVIFHNEAYSNSNSSEEESPKRSPSPKKGSFVSAIISAIKNTATAPFKNASKNSLDDNSDSTELLESESEPCLMMENVLEDNPPPDGHTYNMISSTHSLRPISQPRMSRSDSLHSLPHNIFRRQDSESLYGSYSENTTSLSLDICPAATLVDQVIDADNLLTKLLKVLRIIQLENDSCISDLQDERTDLAEKLRKQRENTENAVQQLKDWEKLGSNLKSELRETKRIAEERHREIEGLKLDIHERKKQIELLSQDVCTLSTECSKLKNSNNESSKNGDKSNDSVKNGDISEDENLKEKLLEKERQLDELVQEFEASRRVMSENWSQAVDEARKQYEAIDTALEILHSVQGVVQQCPQLAKLQRDLEETSFRSASTVPFVAADYNANAALLRAFANMSLAASPQKNAQPPINV